MTHHSSEDFDLLRNAAQEAARLALTYWGRTIEQGRKPDGSTVTEADHAVDALLAERLRGARPDYGWLSEESAEHDSRLNARRVWVVDPIDGTRAFLQGRNDWTVSAALVEDGAPTLAVVVNPVREETFEARAGGGAALNGRAIHVSDCARLDGAKVLAPESILKNSRWRTPWPAIKPVWANSILYRMALVACGEADATFATKPKWEWDVAAGALLVAEAGGVVTDPTGAPLRFNSAEAQVRGFLASGPNLYQILLNRMGEAL
jgi:myo-inositol-1(or 4)-monophosphatase